MKDVLKKIFVTGTIASVLTVLGGSVMATSESNTQANRDELSELTRKFNEEPGLSKKMIHLVNIKRYQAGLPLLEEDAALKTEVRQKVVKANGVGQGVSVPGENTAKGKNTPAEIMKRWMKNPSSRGNILNSNYQSIGSGYYNGVWALKFKGNQLEESAI